MAARSYDISIVNLTNMELTREKSHLDHGVWSGEGSETPPDKIAPGETVHFGSESQGFMTGTEGYVTYGSPAGDFTVYWDNPYVGSDSSSATCPSGYEKVKSDSAGNNATLKVVFYENS
ncbi:aegerolysin family protein [Streptomyces sp. 8K308]|uniref:aegerolysin family protein n=1 Tax=Streptomyces sp. 8K308 TaxID=2530388 RepID=UPI0014044577|nr:aegerolysin family protein [Streptomyces sp. 8K308]